MSEFFTVRGIPEKLKLEFKLACAKKKETAGKAITRLMSLYVKGVIK
jgi:hypothetical protein